MNSIKFTIDHANVRRISLERDTLLTFGKLQELAVSLYPELSSSKFSVSWTDDEADHVNISSDIELFEAVRIMAKHSYGGYLRFNLSLNCVKNKSESAHYGVRCDGCNQCPIVGPRYKCTRRHDFDLCSKCEEISIQPFPMTKIYCHDTASPMNDGRMPEDFLAQMLSGVLQEVAAASGPSSAQQGPARQCRSKCPRFSGGRGRDGGSGNAHCRFPGRTGPCPWRGAAAAAAAAGGVSCDESMAAVASSVEAQIDEEVLEAVRRMSVLEAEEGCRRESGEPCVPPPLPADPPSEAVEESKEEEEEYEDVEMPVPAAFTSTPASAPAVPLASTGGDPCEVWGSELAVLEAMGFSDLDTLLPLLREHVVTPQSMISDKADANAVKAHTEGMQTIIMVLLR